MGWAARRSLQAAANGIHSGGLDVIDSWFALRGTTVQSYGEGSETGALCRPATSRYVPGDSIAA
jgi:hypothetical protein